MSAPSSQVVALRCGPATFGVSIDRVREIVMVPEITPVPESGPFIRGIINLRGRILPVLDLGQRLGLEAGPRDDGGRILVVEQDGGRHPLGLLVDEASEVLRLPAEAIGAPPETAGGNGSGSVKGVARLEGRLILLLDLERVLSDPRVKAPEAHVEPTDASAERTVDKERAGASPRRPEAESRT